MPFLRYPLFLSLFFLGLSASVRASEPVYADLFLHYDNRGRVVALLYPYTDGPPKDSGALRAALEETLGGPLRDVHDGIDDDEDWYLRAVAGNASRRLFHVHRIQTAPILAALRKNGVPGVDVYVLHPAAGYSRMDGAELREFGEDVTEYDFSAPPRTKPLTVAYGYTAGALARLFLPFAILLALPVLATLLMRGIALRASGTDPAAVWFGYWRFLNIMTWTAWGLWLTASLMSSTDGFLDYLLDLSSGQSFMLDFALFVTPMALALTVCMVLSHEVFARYRGVEWTRRDTLRQTLWTYGAAYLPLMLFMGGLGFLFDENLRLAALSFLLVYIARLYCAQALARANEMEPHALSVGDLRDRVFALAEKAGVRLKQLYVLPAGRGHLVNAFALSGGVVMISEEVLLRFSRREVDAVAAHELSHLRKKHTAAWRPILVYVLIMAVAVGMAVLNDQAPDGWNLELLVPVPLFLVLAGGLYLSRRREVVADLGAVELTGDPEAMITAIVKLASLNRLPVEWGRWSERLITHPSSLRRAKAVAHAAGIPPDHLESLLQDRGEPEDRYEAPAVAQSGEAVFSTTVKTSLASRFGWSQIIARSLVPALFALAAAAFPAWRLTIWAAGVPATLAVCLMLRNLQAGRGFTPLRRAFARKLESRGVIPGEWGATFVGFAPHSAPRLYEHFTEWDLGYLFLTRDSLVYMGEQISFSLLREEVNTVATAPGFPSLLPSRSVCVDWRADGRSGRFRLEMSEEPTRLRGNRAAAVMARRIEAWRTGSPDGPAVPGPLTGLGAPDIGDVTSQSPRDLVRGADIRSNVLFIGMIAFGTALLVGLPTLPRDGGGALYTVAVAVLATLLEALPLRRYRDPAGTTCAQVPSALTDEESTHDPAVGS